MPAREMLLEFQNLLADLSGFLHLLSDALTHFFYRRPLRESSVAVVYWNEATA